MRALPRAAAWAVALAAVAAIARSVALESQPLTATDIDVGLTARNFVRYGWPEPIMWNHPRLRDLLVFASREVIGDGAWGLKLWSVILGTLSVVALAAMVQAVTGSGFAAVAAASLVALDPLHVDFSRQAINDVYLSFFPVAAIAATWRYRRTRGPAWLVAAGVLFGLGMAAKWSVAFPAAVALTVVVADALRARMLPAERSAELAFISAALVLLAAAVYVLTFLPWFGRGHGLGDFIQLQREMGLETATHTGYAGTKEPGYPGEIVRAWRWFVSPVYYVDSFRDGRMVGIGNPIAWLAVLPASALVGWRAWRRRDGAAATLLALLAATYLPLVLAPRPIWTNTALAVAPFSSAVLGLAAATLRERAPRLVAAWLGAVALAGLVLWFPATATRTKIGDTVVRMLVPSAALEIRR